MGTPEKERGRVTVEVELEVPQEVIEGGLGIEVGSRIVMGALGSIKLPTRISVNRIQAIKTSLVDTPPVDLIE